MAIRIIVTISDEDIASVTDAYKDATGGKKPSARWMRAFFKSDIPGVYGDTFEEGLEDSVEAAIPDKDFVDSDY